MDEKGLKELKIAYDTVFSGKSADLVVADLKRYCYVDTTSFVADTNRAAYNEGLRSAFLYIQTMKNWDLERLKKERLNVSENPE